MTTAKPAVEFPEPTKPRPSQLFPGLVSRIVIALCLVAIVIVRTLPTFDGVPSPWNDMALANILTLVFGFVAAVALVIWFCFLSNYPPLLRRIVLAGIPAMIGLFFLFFRFVGVNGEMIPIYEPRWQPVADTVIGKIEAKASAPAADLATTTPDDFPQFLGPERNCWLPQPELARDWAANPPRELWRRTIGAGWSAFTAVNGFAVTMEQRGPEEWVACYEVATGNPVWGHSIEARHENPLGGIGPRSTPTIHEGRVYALGATGMLRCLDGKTGAPLWQVNLRERYFGETPEVDEQLVQWGRAASPLVVDDLVVVPAGGLVGQAKSLIAFKAKSGELVWEGGADQISYSSPAVATTAGVRQILIVNEASASGHDPQTGTLLWSHPWPGNSTQNASSSQAVPVDESRVLLTKGYGVGAELLEFKPLAGGGLEKTSVWTNPQVLETKFTNVSIIDGHIFGLSNGYLECVELATGRKTWKRSRKASYGHGQILGVGDLILVQAEDGRLVLVEANPREHIERGSIQVLTDKTWNNLCLYGRKLLVRNAREAACYELP
ncbi:MAG: PQQ-binding-like beta-propeller repeat protein [Planctomycetaceae bacterium]|nr:PQQ-binding-like beta-propeller repeat protein [Planctomycetaceae bacterium]